MQDQIYSSKQSHIVDFAFNEEVVAVFPDMIRRSVPGYETMVPITALMAARHLGNSGLAIDLGCSLGATTLALLQQNQSEDVSVVGVDSSSAMIAGAKQAVRDPRCRFVQQDIRETDLTGANVVILNLVLQFLAVDDRLSVLSKIRQQMQPNGLLLVSEKVQNPHKQLHNFYDETHLAWKQANGYSNLEVSQKRLSLENVMRVDSEEVHIQRFQDAGFSQVEQWYRCMNWASFTVQA